MVTLSKLSRYARLRLEAKQEPKLGTAWLLFLMFFSNSRILTETVSQGWYYNFGKNYHNWYVFMLVSFPLETRIVIRLKL